MLSTEQTSQVMNGAPASISSLRDLVAGLSPQDRGLFNRIFNVSETTGTLVAPETMVAWIEKLFGSVEAVTQQRILKTTNLYTLEGSLFNTLRSSRPIEARDGSDLYEQIMGNAGDRDPFCVPDRLTPADDFGRIEGKYSVTASNVAKYDGYHGLVVFHEHNPLAFSREAIRDYLQVAWQWGQAAYQHDPSGKYFFFMWNCLWKSGASIIHGHAQMALTHDIHYAKVEHLRRVMEWYRGESGDNYFDHLYRAHAALGLAHETPYARIFASLTPVKEKEVFDPGGPPGRPPGRYALRRAARVRGPHGRDQLQRGAVHATHRPNARELERLPCSVPRGGPWRPDEQDGDVGAMEMYASSVISSDPFVVIRHVRECCETPD